MSLELETLDQLLGGPLPLATVRTLFPDDSAFLKSVHALLRSGDVQLIGHGGNVPTWRWRELFIDGAVLDRLAEIEVAVTEQGARRVT